MNSVSVVGLYRVFKRGRHTHWALRDVYLQVKSGGMHAIVGESGAGKSTLAKILAGLEGFDAGLIQVGDFELRPKTGVKKGYHRYVQYLFQAPVQSFNPDFTVLDVLREPLRIHRIKDQGVIESLLIKLDLKGFTKRRARSLSGGEAHRLALARALALSPRVLIADELTAGQDAARKVRILTLLKNIQKDQGVTIILITHEVRLAMAYSEHCSVLYQGMLMESGPTKDCLSSPIHPYTQALIDATRSIEDPSITPPAGEPPSPQGCPFLSNCKRADPMCRVVPPLRGINGRLVRCHHPLL